MSIVILNPGLFSTIQDQGRFEGLDFGVTQSGVMDSFAGETANKLVDNSLDSPVIEVVAGVFSFQAQTKTLFAVTGADVEMTLNQVQIKTWETYGLEPGDIVRLRSIRNGFRNYIAIGGKWKNVSYFLSSCSTDLKSNLGGLGKGKLEKGDVVKVLGRDGCTKNRVSKPPSDYFRQLLNTDKSLRVILGPQEDYFDRQEIDRFLRNPYEVDPASNRMGIRLRGSPIKHLKSPDILSDGIVFGSIQIPGDGLPIIMMADRQTTGGYAKIATVVSRDLPILAQAKPGDRVWFKETVLEDMWDLEQSMTFQKNKVTASRQVRVKVNNEDYALLVEEMT